MLLILLNDVFGVSIKLKNFLVCASSKEYVLLIFSGVKFDAEGGLTVGKTSNYLPCLCVPELDNFIERCTEELFTIVSKLNISHCFGVTHVRPEAFSVC